MRRILMLAAIGLAASCGGGDGDGDAVDRDALIEQIVEGARGTVGEDGVPCLQEFLDDRSDEELDDLANGGNDSLNREFTDVIVACVDG